MKLLRYTPAFLSALFVWACASPPDYPIEPVIEYIGMTKNVMKRGLGPEDTTFVTIAFTDGDGDLGDEESDSLNLFVTDLRTGILENQYRIPFLPDLGSANGIRGEITFRLFTTCCIFPPELGLDPCFDTSPEYPMDTVRYSIYIVDRAGHKSNVVETEPIFILCQ